jgi:uncharacterized membrane protein YqiK
VTKIVVSCIFLSLLTLFSMRVFYLNYEDKPQLEDYMASVRSVSPQSCPNLVIPEYETRMTSITLQVVSIHMRRSVFRNFASYRIESRVS